MIGALAGPRPEPDGRDGRPALRGVVAARLLPDVRRGAAGRGGGRGARGRVRAGGRRPCVGPRRRGPSDAPSDPRRARAPSPARRAAPGLPRRPRHGPVLRGEGRRVHPDHRRRGQAVLGLPGVPSPEAGGRRRARLRPHDHPDADGQRVPAAGPVLEVLRPRHGRARRGDPRHGRAARLVPARLHVPVLREPRVLRAHELHRQLQPAARDLRDRAEEGLAGAQLLLQHDVRDGQPARLRRAVVPAGRLRAPARGDGPRVRLERLSRRRRPRERLGSDRGARPRLLPRAHVLGGDRAPRDTRRRADAHDRDRLPSADLRAHEPDHRVQRLLAADELRQPRRDRRVLGLPGASRDHGPLAAPEVRGARTRRRGADAGDRDPRRPAARRRPRRLHRDVQRGRRDDRRRDDLPDRRTRTSASSAAASTTASGSASRPPASASTRS